MENQVTLRLPAELARRLAARAKAQGIKRSAVIREALEQALGAPNASDPAVVTERMRKYAGIIAVDPASFELDDLARTIRDHNWRV